MLDLKLPAQSRSRRRSETDYLKPQVLRAGLTPGRSENLISDERLAVAESKTGHHRVDARSVELSIRLPGRPLRRGRRQAANPGRHTEGLGQPVHHRLSATGEVCE